MASPDPFGLVGQVLDGQFRVDRFIGEGGFGVVYAGLHLGLAEPIAIKCMKLPPQLSAALIESFVQRFRDESRLHYKLSQGNLHIARTMAAGTAVSPVTREVVPYMVLEWLDGHSLAVEFERAPTKRSLFEVLGLFETAVDALTYAQAQGVIHRDLNPGNFFLTRTIAGTRLKVLDFGVAKVLDESRLALGPRAQTLGQIRIFAPAYGAPEQFDDALGPVGPSTDVYSLALVLLEAMAGRTVMSGEHLGDYAQGALDPVTRPSPRGVGVALPPEVEAVFARALALRPADRWPKVQDFWVALRFAARMPGASPEEEGKATMVLATMELAAKGQVAPPPPPSAPGSERTLVDPIEEPALRAQVAEAPPDAEAYRPSRPGMHAALASLAAAPVVAPGSAEVVAVASGAPALPVFKQGDRSQLVTLSMSSRPSLPGQERASAVPGLSPPPRVGVPPPARAPSSPALVAAPPAPPSPPPQHVATPPPPHAVPALGATMAMSRAPTVPVSLALDITARAPVQAQAQTAVLRARPGSGAHRAEVVHEAEQARASEPPAAPRPWPAAPLPPQAFVPATPGGTGAVDDEPVTPPRSRPWWVLGLLAVAGVVAAGVYLVGRSRHVAAPPDAASIFSEPAVDAAAAPGSASSPLASAEPSAAPPLASAAPSSSAPSAPSSTASASPSASPSAAPTPQGPGPRKPPVGPAVPVDPNAWNPAAARAKLDNANSVLVICKKPGGPSGRGTASVVFAPSGQVSSVSLDGPFANTPVGSCVSGQFLRAKTTPFTGPAQPMSYTFTVPK